jgi:hypothetical protein
MNHSRALFVSTVAIGLVVAAGVAFAAAPKPKTVTFKGSYAGQVTEKVNGADVSGLASATGTSTAVGAGTVTGTVAGTTSNPPCSPLTGKGVLSGRKGKLKLSLLSTSRACAASATDQNSVTFSGDAKVMGGTLKFKKAKGTIHFSGNYDRTSGAFNAKFTGKLTY